MNDNGDGVPSPTQESPPPNKLSQRTILPVELLISILELSLVSNSWSSRATQLGLVLLVDRTTYTGVVKSAYSAVVLSDIKTVELFLRTIESSSYLAGLIVNLWIATPRRLNGFDTSNYPARVIENKISIILSKAENLKRVAVPHEYIPRIGFPRVEHLSTSNNLFPPAIPVLASIKSLHIRGLPGRNCVNTIISRFPELRSLKIAFLASGSDPGVSVLCARMVLLFRQRLKSMTSLEINANATVVDTLRAGLKKTLEEDPRLRLEEQPEERESVENHLLLQDNWLIEYGQ